MKKLSRILGIVLSMVLIFGVVGAGLTACPDPKGKDVTVKFMYDSGETASIKVKSGEKITTNQLPNDPYEATKVFKFWSEDKETDFISSGKPTSNITLTPVFRAREEGEWVVHFDSSGGSYVKSQVVLEGAKATKPSNPQKSGFAFEGWLDSAIAFNFDTVITKDYRLKAKWGGAGEGKVLVQSSGEFDGVFSPFFSTSAYDGAVHGETQASMLSSDREGKVYVGEDVPSVVKDFSQVIYLDEKPNPTEDDLKDLTPYEKKGGNDRYRTEYQFVIKNGILFSDGHELTIKDVLFNMYVYLDPSYTGSSTMYSTNIWGLQAYRMQDPEAEDDGSGNDEYYRTQAGRRMERLRNYYDKDPSRLEQNRLAIAANPEQEFQLLKDVQMMREEFWLEINSLWNSVTAIEDVKKDFEEYGFTEHWEVFLYYLDLITAKYNNDGTVKIDPQTQKPDIEYADTKEWFHDRENLLKIVYNNKVGILVGDERGNNYSIEDGNPIIDLKFDEAGNINGNMFEMGTIEDKENRETLVCRLREYNTLMTNALMMSYYNQAGNALFSYMIADERDIALQELQEGTADGRRRVEDIRGITVEKVTEFVNDKEETVKYDEEHYVLKINVAAVDPKAIWNFGFTVSPMHYYSDPSGRGTTFQLESGYSSFNYPGVDGYDEKKPTHLGFEQLDFAYFNQVLKHTDVLGVPMGAGPFRATNYAGADSGIIPSTFFNNGIVNLKRNDYFYTTGSEMNNVQFEFMKYQVIDTTKVLDTLREGSVHIGDPSAVQKNVTAVGEIGHLSSQLIKNNGYGYVGVNAAHVPDIDIRRAIMTALDTSKIMDYYTGGLAQLISRPMSIVNWAYPKDATDYYEFGNREEAKAEIERLVKKAGYDENRISEGAYEKNNEKTDLPTNLKFVFTVAGSSVDHPAYIMFTEAAALLNECGFNITVRNDAQALRKLSNGELEIWAAAWQSSIDPDMFQIYHKESRAQSVKNWGYPYLIDQGNGTDEEQQIIEDLSNLIDDGRKIIKQEDRESIYHQALDKVMELAVEYPTYQRENLIVYNNTIINEDSVISNPTPFWGVFSRIWKIELL